MNAKHDWTAIERKYVMGDYGIRTIARMYGITNHSIVAEQSVRREWARKREEYRARAAETAMTKMADKEGARVAREMEVRDNAIDAIDEAISKMRADMQATRKTFKDGVWGEEPLIVVRPQDIAVLIDRLNVLFGRPSNITEERNLGLSISGSAGPELLRSIIEATRGIGPVSGDAATSPIPRAGGTREN